MAWPGRRGQTGANPASRARTGAGARALGARALAPLAWRTRPVRSTLAAHRSGDRCRDAALRVPAARRPAGPVGARTTHDGLHRPMLRGSARDSAAWG